MVFWYSYILLAEKIKVCVKKSPGCPGWGGMKKRKERGEGKTIAKFLETSVPCCLLPIRKVEEWIELYSAENPRTLEDDLLPTYWESAEHQAFIH